MASALGGEGEFQDSPSFIPKKSMCILDTRLEFSNLSARDEAALSRKLSIYDTYSKWPRVLWKAMTQRTEGDTVITAIPRYMTQGQLKSLVDFTGLELRREDHRLEPPRVEIPFSGAPRSDIQRQAIEYMFTSTGEFRNSTRILDLPVGEGKTFLSLYAIAKLGVKANIIVHKATMIETPWKKDIEKFTGIAPDEIGVIQGSESIPKILKLKDKYKIFVTVHRTFENFLNSPKAYEKLNSLYADLGIGMNVIDEAHKEMMSTFFILMNSNVKYTLFVTATLARTDKLESDIYRCMVPVSQSFASNNYVAPQKFVTYRPRPFESSPDSTWKRAMDRELGVKMSVYCSYLATEEDAIIKLYEGIKSAIFEIEAESPGGHIAVVLGTLELVSKIIDALGDDFDPGSIGNFTGMLKPKQRVLELTKHIIVTTDKSMDSAIDCSVNSMILCVPVTSEVQLTQIIGRIRYAPGSKLPVYDVVDIAFSKSRRNFTKRKSFITKNIALEVEP